MFIQLMLQRWAAVFVRSPSAVAASPLRSSLRSEMETLGPRGKALYQRFSHFFSFNPTTLFLRNGVLRRGLTSGIRHTTIPTASEPSRSLGNN
uniref:Putative secreted peptide n=1 Tax=Anopheles braziliensis TaxID=58242 RepID=A0A2M3ZWN6_9DIPT